MSFDFSCEGVCVSSRASKVEGRRYLDVVVGGCSQESFLVSAGEAERVAVGEEVVVRGHVVRKQFGDKATRDFVAMSVRAAEKGGASPGARSAASK